MSQSSPVRYVLHLRFPDFYVELERLRRPHLARKPSLIVSQGARSVVIASSVEARAVGIEAGFPLRRARVLAPEAVALPGDLDHYARCARRVEELLAPEVPCYEAASLDSYFVELTGMERFFGVEAFAQGLGDRLGEITRLPIRLGLAPNKLLAQMASGEAQTQILRHLIPDQAEAFLAPLSVQKLPGIGAEITRQLRHLGIRQIGQLRRMPRLALTQTFGPLGARLHAYAHGQDDRPLYPPQQTPHLAQSVRFDPACDDPAELLRQLNRLIETLGFQLRQRRLLCTQLSLSLRFGDGQAQRRQARLSGCASDGQLLASARPLLRQLTQRRQRIRRLTLQLGDLLPGQPQLHLFQSQAQQVELYETLDELRLRYGLGVLRRASGL